MTAAWVMSYFLPMSRQVIMLLAVCILLAGCSTLGYYAQSIDGHLRLMGERQPISRLLADPDTSPALRQRLQLALRLRDFASSRLALPDNGSYRAFAAVEGEAVVWSLVATEEFSIEPKQWCYPIVGCAAYRGYFSRGRAGDHAALLAAQGLDVAVEPVAAYSTLVWFDDPLPETVIHWPEARLAGLIFHELAHQQLYLPGDTPFNEGFASLVAEVGVERWLLANGSEATVAAWGRSRQREAAFIDLLLGAREALGRLYAENLPESKLRAGKAAVFARLRGDYAGFKAAWGGYRGYDGWFLRKLNNAHLASIATYAELVPAFRRLLAEAGGDLESFYRACAELAAQDAAERRRRLAGVAPGDR